MTTLNFMTDTLTFSPTKSSSGTSPPQLPTNAFPSTLFDHAIPNPITPPITVQIPSFEEARKDEMCLHEKAHEVATFKKTPKNESKATDIICKYILHEWYQFDGVAHLFNESRYSFTRSISHFSINFLLDDLFALFGDIEEPAEGESTMEFTPVMLTFYDNFSIMRNLLFFGSLEQ